jgi:DNA replication protein DnaC
LPTTLPERLALARSSSMGHAEFLELVLADEVSRRESMSAERRSRAAGLDPAMTLDRWDDTAKVGYDQAVWHELCSLRFMDGGHNAVIMGPVGVGKTFLAAALGHAAVRRRYSVHFERSSAMGLVKEPPPPLVLGRRSRPGMARTASQSAASLMTRGS